MSDDPRKSPTPHAGIRCMLMRGGTSKGAYFVASELPETSAERDAVLLSIMGSPDARQIDGVGGAHPLTSKVAIVSASPDAQADVDYLFLQVGVETAFVTDKQNCGNLLAGVGPFAIERGLVKQSGPHASVRIRMLNTGGVATAGFDLDDGLPIYSGDCSIAGVPGTAAPIILTFEGTAGSSCGNLLPTGHTSDLIDGVQVTCIDNGMPVVVVAAADVGVSGYESCDELESNTDLRRRVESLRLLAGAAMGLGDVAALTIPKVTLVSAPMNGGTICTRSFIPHRCHDAIGVLGAVTVATAALLPDSPAARVSAPIEIADRITIEHPTGTLDATVSLRRTESGFEVGQCGIVRTARKLMDGTVFPRSDEW